MSFRGLSRRLWLLLPAAGIILVVVYARAWDTHSRLRSSINLDFLKALPSDGAGFRPSDKLPDRLPDGEGTVVVVRGLRLRLPLKDVTNVVKLHGADVGLGGSERVISVHVIEERYIAPLMQADFESLKAVAAAPPPSRYWPLFPDAIKEVYARYAFKMRYLGSDRRAFDNGAVQGIIGRAHGKADQFQVTMVGQHVFVRVDVRDEPMALAIAGVARPQGTSVASTNMAPDSREKLTARAIECALRRPSDRWDDCTLHPSEDTP
jgi:hypothetical protein